MSSRHRCCTVLVLLVVGLVATVPAAASSFLVSQELSYGDLDFSLDPLGQAKFLTDLESADYVFVNSPIGRLPVSSLTFSAVSGYLLTIDRHRFNDPVGDYDLLRYDGGGPFSMLLTLELPNGSTHAMTLRGNTSAFYIEAGRHGGVPITRGSADGRPHRADLQSHAAEPTTALSRCIDSRNPAI